MKFEKLIIIDFGSKYTQELLKKSRQIGIYSKLYNYDLSAKEIKNLENVKGIILIGDYNFIDRSNFTFDQEIFNLNIPILGFDYGYKLIKDHYHNLTPTNPKIQDDPKSTFKLNNNITAVKFIENKNIGIEFNSSTVTFDDYLRNLSDFIFNICKIKPKWNMDNFLKFKLKEIKETVKDEKVLLAISGGVDSSVAAVLISKAIGSNLTCMFIDHGLLRLNEANEVMAMFKNFNIDVIKIDAQDYFLGLLEGVTDPEAKRKIIGGAFIDTFEKESKKLSDFKFLAQGTLYSDVIESGSKTAKMVKSHHNVGGLPEHLDFELLEPFNILFKDEVRQLGLIMDMPKELIYRQPFPGPGLAIRIIGDITKEKIRIVQKTDYILRDEIKKHNLDNKIWQYFTVLTGIKTVGVKDGERTYSYTIAIRAVHSEDGMTSTWAKIPYEVLDIISKRMVLEVNGCNRIVLDITSKPPATIEWE